MIEWFRPGDHEIVEQVLADMRILAIRELRTGILWSDFHKPECQDWYRWLFRRLAREVHVLPCFVSTLPNLGLEPKICAPPQGPGAYADLIEAP